MSEIIKPSMRDIAEAISRVVEDNPMKVTIPDHILVSPEFDAAMHVQAQLLWGTPILPRRVGKTMGLGLLNYMQENPVTLSELTKKDIENAWEMMKLRSLPQDSCERCASPIGGCPFSFFSEESEKIQNYGCLPTPMEIVTMRTEHNKTWACHSNPKKPCIGAIQYLKEKGLPYKVVDHEYVTAGDDWLPFVRSKTEESISDE